MTGYIKKKQGGTLKKKKTKISQFTRSRYMCVPFGTEAKLKQFDNYSFFFSLLLNKNTEL